MIRFQPFPSERKIFSDSATGARIIRLTSFPTIHENMANCFTPDSKTLIFAVNKSDRRNTYSSYDIYKVNTDGHGLVRLSEGYLAGACVSPVQRCLYYTGNGSFHRLDLDTAEDTQLCAIPSGLRGDCLGFSSMTFDGFVYMAHGICDDGRQAFVRFTTDGAQAEIIFKTARGLMCPKIEPSEGMLAVYQTSPDEKHRNLVIVHLTDGSEKPLELPYGNGHWSWHGAMKKIMSCLDLPLKKGISVYGEQDGKTLDFSGFCYWHASSGMDGRHIIADTNWPDTGLVLIDTETGEEKVLCLPQSSSAHPQWTHCHPTLSPDCRMALFKSDRDRFPHLYLAMIE